jgi:hypothetical protein
MELSQKQFEQIEDYLLKKLSPEELVTFESELKNNELMKNELSNLKSMQSGLRRLKFQEEFRIIHSDLQSRKLINTQPSKIFTQNVFRIFAIAASIFLMLFAGWQTRNYLSNQKNDEELVVSTKNKNSPNINQKVTPKIVEERILVAESKYSKIFKSNFTTSLRVVNKRKLDELTFSTGITPLFDEKIKQIGVDTTNIKKAISLINLGKTTEAIELLKVSSDCTFPIWRNHAHWYLAMAFIRNKQPQKAKIELQILSKEDSEIYKADAIKILSDIDGK